MFQLKKITINQDFFLERGARGGEFVYAIRLQGYASELDGFLFDYYKAAQGSGLVQLEKLPNPTTDNLDYYTQMVGGEFLLEQGFFSQKLSKWLPRLSPMQNQTIASAMFDTLTELQSAGKNLNILKNVFIKFMCWMYYRLERLLRQLGGSVIPKILYQGAISDNELRMFTVCVKAGCDFLLIDTDSPENYGKLDGGNRCTSPYNLCQLQPFSKEFSVKNLIDTAQSKEKIQSQVRVEKGLNVQCNGWKQMDGISDCKTKHSARGGSKELFFPCFRMICGTEDKVNYEGNVYRFLQEMETSGRKVVTATGLIPPTPTEISQIKRDNYPDVATMCAHLGRNIQYSSSPNLQKQMLHGFLAMLLVDEEFLELKLNRQTSVVIYLLCWMKNVQNELFTSFLQGELGCYVLLHGCFKLEERLFLQWLSCLPTDVLVLAPDLSKQPIAVKHMLVENYTQSLEMEVFPTSGAQAQIGTTAYHAERELDGMLYQDTGIYRAQQFTKATPILLRTMYEEIGILWNQELKFRPNFSTIGGQVHMPVLFAKVSGVKENPTVYWNSIRNLATPETFVITKVPFFTDKRTELHGLAPSFYNRGKLRKQEIMTHSAYEYSYLRNESQEHILDCLEIMLEEKNIKGMGQNGMEFKVIGDILSLDKDILRMIQWFDFTQKNPKIIYIQTTEAMPSVEDAIVLAFLNLVGFDVVNFVPTGYQGVEGHYLRPTMEEHQIGSYAYDLSIPNLNPEANPLKKLGKKIFNRGG